MALNCTDIQSILRDCSTTLGGIANKIWINDSENVDWVSKTFDSSESHIINSLSLNGTAPIYFEMIEFRRNLATLNEDYPYNEDGAVVFEQTLTLPIHGRDAAKSRKISVIAAGHRLVDIIVPQNDGGYVYLREAVLNNVTDGTGATKADGSKYTLTFTSQTETLALFIDPNIIPNLDGTSGT